MLSGRGESVAQPLGGQVGHVLHVPSAVVQGGLALQTGAGMRPLSMRIRPSAWKPFTFATAIKESCESPKTCARRRSSLLVWNA